MLAEERTRKSRKLKMSKGENDVFLDTLTGSCCRTLAGK